MVHQLGAKTVAGAAAGVATGVIAIVESVDPTQVIVGAMALVGVLYADRNRTQQKRIDAAQQAKAAEADARRDELAAAQAAQAAKADHTKSLVDSLQEETVRLRSVEAVNAVRLVDIQNRLWEAEGRERRLAVYSERLLAGIHHLIDQLVELGVDPSWKPDDPPASTGHDGNR